MLLYFERSVADREKKRPCNNITCMRKELKFVLKNFYLLLCLFMLVRERERERGGRESCNIIILY
jgi:hypothetical protein